MIAHRPPLRRRPATLLAIALPSPALAVEIPSGLTPLLDTAGEWLAALRALDWAALATRPETGLALAALAGAFGGAAALALLRRRRHRADPAQLTRAAHRARPSGSLWRGLCHFVALESGARLVTFHQPRAPGDAPWPLSESWQAFAGEPPLAALPACHDADTHRYGLGAEPLPAHAELRRLGISCGYAAPVLGDRGQLIGRLSAFFARPEEAPVPPPVLEQTATLLASLHTLQHGSPLDLSSGQWDESLIDRVPAAASINAADGRPVRSNDRYLAMFGEGDLEHDDTQVLDYTLTDGERPDAIEALCQAESELLRRRAAVVRELSLPGDGQPRALCYVGVPLLAPGDGASQRLAGFVSLVFDPNENGAALALPRSLEQRALATVQCLGEALISVDNHGQIRYLNPAARDLLGVDLAHATGRRVTDVATVVHANTGARIDLDHLPEEDIKLGDISLDDVLLRRPDGRELPLHISCSAVRNRDGIRQGASFLLQDVTHQRRLADTLLRQANFDQLTGLTNRQRFSQLLDEALREVRDRHTDRLLLYIDIDRFKLVNDSVGHIAGDALLQQLAILISTHLRTGDELARLGGDEFGVLVRDGARRRGPLMAKQLIDELNEFRFHWQGRSHAVRASIGIAPVVAEVHSALELMQRAVVACQTAKESGHWSFLVYGASNSMPVQRRREMKAVETVQSALNDNRFRLFAQPIVPLSPGGQLNGIQRHELLLRLLDGDDRIQHPGQFMSAAERYGLMPAIDRWVIHYALEVCAELQNNASTRFELGINLSGPSLGDPTLLDYVQQEFARHGLQGNRICFEITETTAIGDVKVAQRFIEEMKNEGCTFALDDFGSGLSTFSYLKDLAVDYLKIDGSFVRDITTNNVDRSIVEGICTVARQIELQTIAEFVENAQTIELLRELGVDHAQGYHIGEPRPLAELIGEAVG